MKIPEKKRGDRARLGRLMKKERDRRKRLKLRAVQLAIQGETARVISLTVGWSESSVKRWGYAYRDGGIGGVWPQLTHRITKPKTKLWKKPPRRNRLSSKVYQRLHPVPPATVLAKESSGAASGGVPICSRAVEIALARTSHSSSVQLDNAVIATRSFAHAISDSVAQSEQEKNGGVAALLKDSLKRAAAVLIVGGMVTLAAAVPSSKNNVLATATGSGHHSPPPTPHEPSPVPENVSNVFDIPAKFFAPGPLTKGYLEWLNESKGASVVPKALIAPIVIPTASRLDSIMATPGIVADTVRTITTPAGRPEQPAANKGSIGARNSDKSGGVSAKAGKADKGSEPNSSSMAQHSAENVERAMHAANLKLESKLEVERQAAERVREAQAREAAARQAADRAREAQAREAAAREAARRAQQQRDKIDRGPRESAGSRGGPNGREHRSSSGRQVEF
jgi:hypothetical protein